MGEGEGSSDEEINGELYRIYQEQQKLRQALQDKIGKDGNRGEVGDLIKKMEHPLNTHQRNFTTTRRSS